MSGPGNGTNVDDYYSPEINSTVIPLNVTTATGQSCNPIPDPSQTGAYTDSFANSDGSAAAPVPNVFGMNFQAVSLGQKLIEKNVGTGGYRQQRHHAGHPDRPAAALLGVAIEPQWDRPNGGPYLAALAYGSKPDRQRGSDTGSNSYNLPGLPPYGTPVRPTSSCSRGSA